MQIYEKRDIVFRWKFFQYVSPQGRRAIDDWRKSMRPGPRRADMDQFLKILAKKKIWEYPDIVWLKGKELKGLSELRWKSERVPHRLLGYALREGQYLVLIGCTHNARKYDPPEALKSARDRRQQIENREASFDEYKLVTDS